MVRGVRLYQANCDGRLLVSIGYLLIVLARHLPEVSAVMARIRYLRAFMPMTALERIQLFLEISTINGKLFAGKSTSNQIIIGLSSC